MLVSKDMQERSRALEDIFKPRGIKVSKLDIKDPWNASQISDQVLNILAEYPNKDIALNATGGTKLMSIAAYEAFRYMEYPIFYVHPERDELLWLNTTKAPQALNGQLKIKDYLTAYGASHVEPSTCYGVKQTIRDLTHTLLVNIDRYAEELATVNYLALKADNPKLSIEIEDSARYKPLLWELLELFASADLCKINGQQLQFTDEESRFFVNGGWLEQHTYGLCLKLKKELGLQDIAANINIQRQPHGKTPIKNEIDIGLIKHNRLHIIECKTKRYDHNSADVLYKLDSLRDLIGGLQSRAMLVSFNTLDKPSRARAKELNISVCSKTDLQNLQQHISQWLAL
jgi:hypothetical protein